MKKIVLLLAVVLLTGTVGGVVVHGQEKKPNQGLKDIDPVPERGVDLKEVFNDAVTKDDSSNGIKYLDDNHLLQMSDGYSQCGAIWGKKQLDLTKPFEMTFYLYLGGSGSEAGDGMTFSLQTLGNDKVGNDGANMGMYGGGMTTHWYASLEFDTYFNGDGNDYDLSSRGDHIAWNTGGNSIHYSPHIFADGDYMSNAKWKKVNITYKPNGSNGGRMSYDYTDLNGDSNDKFSNYVDFTYDKSGDHNFLNSSNVYWGFTASTGGAMENAMMSFGSLPQQATVRTKDTTLYVGDTWDQSMNFDSATAYDGSDITDASDKRIIVDKGNLDMSKPGNYTVNYHYKDSNQTTDPVPAIVHVVKKKVTAEIKAKDSTLSIGDSWKAKDNFVSCTDDDGNSLPWEDGTITVNGTDNNVPVKDGKVTKVGPYQVTYTYKGADGKFGTSDDVSQTITVTVRNKPSSMVLHDTELFVGQTWHMMDNVTSLFDKDSKPITLPDKRVTNTHSDPNTTKADNYKLTYVLTEDGKQTATASANVVVKADQAALEAIADFDLIQGNGGNAWSWETHFVKAKDSDGSEIKSNQTDKLVLSGDKVDVNKINVYNETVTLTAMSGKKISKNFKVTVSSPLSLTVPDIKDFGSHKLGTVDKVLPWQDAKDVKVDDAANTNWKLTILASGANKDFLKLNGMPITSESEICSDNKTNNNIAKLLSDPNTGLVVDYKSIEKTREDSGTLTWTLSPSDDDIRE